MNKRNIIISLVIILFVCQFATAQIITAKQLAKDIKKDDVTVVSARNAADYKKVHIPEAVNVWHLDLYKEGDVEGILKNTEEIATILGKAGISEKNTLVVYDSGKNIYAGRLYWIFKYLGVENVKVLDGQMKMWRKNRKPVTRKATNVKETSFAVNLNKDIYACKDYIKKNLKNDGVVLLDVRSAEEYNGEKGTAHRKGHIAGAVNLEYKVLINEDGTIKSKEEIDALLSKVGITKDKEVILYCATSVRAGIVFMAMTSISDYTKVRVYDGAINEWAADETLPME